MALPSDSHLLFTNLALSRETDVFVSLILLRYFRQCLVFSFNAAPHFTPHMIGTIISQLYHIPSRSKPSNAF